ncbi:hypothetical protein FHP29_16370 [Nocardioides albidus]|uniref:Uncharacterized protein n=1 Tax=Nocardioides albidus TaxID=1517589 RepID=A0A5C4VPG6_9ACTN|nr:hypothetical protein [Nocardioides albidus]TNM37406.1 hypothetical protein FHP29_16370 [Nocardioides albidus]
MTPSQQQAKAKAEGRICEHGGCENGQFQRRLCGYHYRLMRAEERASEGKRCRVEGCERGWFARGLCRGHYTTEYQRERRAKDRQEERFLRGLADLDDPGVGLLLGRLPAAERLALLREHAARDTGGPLP